jgi:DeoR family transcriptional regulator, aga operon transcriptional repressor
MHPITDLYLEERRQAILDLVEHRGRVAVSELSVRFGVSEVTIRADLQALAERKLLVRTHGGAVPTANGLSELALVLRRQRQVMEKARIGAVGADLVADGDAIFLDSSSTSLAIAHQLRDRRHLTVATNSLEVAHELVDAAGIELIMVGGVLQRATASLVGAFGLDAMQAYNLGKGFFGAHGISPEAGLTDVSPDEAAIKNQMAQQCRYVIAVLDATKWGRVGVASFARLDQVATIITDAGAPPALVEAVRTLGITVLLA